MELNFKYYKYYKGKLMLMVIPLILGVMLIYLVNILIVSYFDVQYNAFVETRKHYTSIQAKGNPIYESTVQAITESEYTDKVVPCVLLYTEILGVPSTIGVRVYMLYQDDLFELIENMGLELVKGRMPEPGKNEIILHESVLTNKGLSIGDEIGSDVLSYEKLLGRYEIVGVLGGKALAGFIPLETWVEEYEINTPQDYGILIYAKEGYLNELNQYISYLPIVGNEISSYDANLQSLEVSNGSVNIILNLINLSIIIIIPLCLSFLTYLFYQNRQKEFAILYIIKYGKHFLLRKNIMENALINIGAYLIGIILSIIIIVFLNIFCFNNLGISLLILSWKTLLMALCIPLMSIVAQTLSIGSLISKTDMISVIEFESAGVL